MIANPARAGCPERSRRDPCAHIDRRYNTAVPAASPPPQPDNPSARHSGKHHIFKLEAVGLLIIGALILIFTLVRYWHHIAWSAR